jgi:ABC-type transport system involved in multi-copper enzyme maturation permease subunit
VIPVSPLTTFSGDSFALFTALDNLRWLTLPLLGAAGLIGLVLLVVLALGLFAARSLVRREFAAYFLSPIAYVVLVVFLLVTGHLFAVTLGLLSTTGPKGTEWPMRTMFGDERFWLVFLFIPPLLTMRLFAEERSSGTLELLMTAPLRDWQVVLAKYFACLAFYVVLWLPTLLYLPFLLGAQAPRFEPAWTPWSVLLLAGLASLLTGAVLLLPRLGTTGRLVSLGLVGVGALVTGLGAWLHYTRDAVHLVEIPVALDPYPVLATYLGMFLAGAMFLALGLLVSSLVRDQLVAAILSLALGLLFIVAGFWRPADGGTLYQAVYFFSVPLHFEHAFTRGVLDTRPVVLYASTALCCLFLTVRSLESRRWQ